MLETGCLKYYFNCFIDFAIVTPVFTQRLYPSTDLSPQYTLALSAAERTQSRLQVESQEGHTVQLQLPRGTILRDGDWLKSARGEVAQVQAKPEPVLTVTTLFPLALLQAAYHLGRRNVPLEITASFLRIAWDPTLHQLLLQRGLQVREEETPFQPEMDGSDQF